MQISNCVGMASEDDYIPSDISLVGYLVRSKKFRIPKNWPKNPQTCLKQMEMLKEVELLQNIQVQKSLKSLIKELDIEKRQSIGGLQSARQYQQEMKRQKCHENVQRIRKLQQNSKDSTLHLNKVSGGFTHVENDAEESVQDTVKNNKKKVKRNVKFEDVHENDGLISSNGNEKKFEFSQSKVEQKLKLPSLVKHELSTLGYGSNQQLVSQESNELTLPKLDAKTSLSSSYLPSKPGKQSLRYCMPVLDSQSKFSIIRTARMLRLNRRKLKDYKDDSEARKEAKLSVREKKIKQESKPFDLFADNCDLLSPRYLVSQGPDHEPMELLDGESFDDIDRDDFLQLENRIVPLSPLPAIVKNKQKEKPLTKLELRKGFR